MKYLITGGAGFIGSHLVKRLLKDGHKVVVVDNFSTGKKRNLPLHKNLEIQTADILDDISFLFRGIDIVFHLAALNRPQESILFPEQTTTVNVDGTVKVLQHCKRHGVKRIVFVSSTALYGEQDVLPTPESAVPNPMSPYALTKLVGEQYCQLYEKMYGLEFNVVRPFNVYGMHQNPEGGYAAAVAKFIDTISKGETPFITGDGTQSRDFIHVDDVVELLVLAAEAKIHGQAFNAGSGESISINALYLLISHLMNKDIVPTYIDPVFEPKQTLGDITKAAKVLGWQPKVSLNDGLERLIHG